jgi:hypothetical protein
MKKAHNCIMSGEVKMEVKPLMVEHQVLV